MGDTLLDSLLSIGAELTSKDEKSKKLQEINLFDKPDLEEPKKPAETPTSSIPTNGGDSSDDELYEPKNLNECGKAIDNLLKTSENNNKTISSVWTNKSVNKQLVVSKPKVTTNGEVTYLPFFGIRVVNPLVSSQLLADRMEGKNVVTLLKLKRFLEQNPKDKDWVIGGVLINKSTPKVSQKGSHFSIWTVSDLQFDLKTISVFLFGGAHKDLWKTTSGTAVAILNPSVLEKSSNSKDEASLSISNSQHMMILGQSKDLGVCKSIKKDGNKCTAFVNTNHCEYCVYHVKQEYQKSSRRSELQSHFSGRGLTALRNKVLGKNEVFYAGKSYTAIPAQKSQKLVKRDEQRLRQLSGQAPIVNKLNPPANLRKYSAATLDVSHKQRSKDLELLQRLGGSLPSKTTESTQVIKSQPTPPLRINTLPNPTLSNFRTVDLNVPITNRRKDIAKLNALKYVQKHGKLEKQDPMSLRGSGTKRILEETDKTTENEPKKQKTDFFSDRFKKMMAATSKNADLLELVEDEQQEKYFKKLEAKERMEEKMSQTFKMNCKAVRCLKCKYTSFSASEKCKSEKHPLKVFDTVKRFFKCADCGNRTVVLTFVPMESCKNCGNGKWEKTSMMKEKNVDKLHSLSIRGGEQTFLNSGVTNGNLDLLVPDE